MGLEKGMEVTHCASDTCPNKANRSCRDVLFLILFMAAIGIMCYFAYLSILKGEPKRLIHGVDSWGNVCNKKNPILKRAFFTGMDMTEKKYSFFFNPLKLSQPNLTTVICVSACNTDTIVSPYAFKDLHEKTLIHLCQYDINPKKMHLQVGKKCPYIPYPATTPILYRCVPDAMIEAMVISASGSSNGIMNVIDKDFANKFASDVSHSYEQIMILSGIAFIGSFIFCLGFGWIAVPMIWVTYFLLFIGTGMCIGYMWYKNGQNIKAEPALTQDYLKKWMAASIVVSCVGGVIIIILIFLRTKIKLVAELYRESGKALRCMPMMLLQPIITMIFLVGATAGMAVTAIYMITSGEQVVNEEGRVDFVADELLVKVRWFHLFVFLWITQFILACQEMVVAGAVAFWFFTRNKKSVGSPVGRSVWNLIRYHLGTVAFGSLIIAIVQLVRVVLASIQARLQGRVSKIVDFLLKCFACCLWCLEKFLKFVNRNAYIECAINNYSFCRGAKEALKVLMENALRVAAINTIGDLILFIAKLGVTAGVVAGGVFFFTDMPDLNYSWLPLLLSGIVAYLIASCFFGVYEMTVDSMFICFCEDLRLNDGVSRPYYMSKGLMQLIDGYQPPGSSNNCVGAIKGRRLVLVDPVARRNAAASVADVTGQPNAVEKI